MHKSRGRAVMQELKSYSELRVLQRKFLSLMEELKAKEKEDLRKHYVWWKVLLSWISRLVSGGGTV